MLSVYPCVNVSLPMHLAFKISFTACLICPPNNLQIKDYFLCLKIYSERIVHLLRRAWLFATPWTAAHQASLSFTFSQCLLKLMSTELMTPSNHLVLYRPLLLPSIFPRIRVFSNEVAFHIRWPKSIGVSASASVLLMIIQDWFPLRLTAAGLLQHHSQKASILWRSTFFMVQLSHPYMIIGKP